MTPAAPLALEHLQQEQPAPARAVRSGGISCWFVVISGFTQNLRQPSGAQDLWNAVRRECLARGDDTAVVLKPWDADWRGLAEEIWRFRPLEHPPHVFCAAYSWGAGRGFPSLARELAKRGIEVAHAVLCDPVPRLLLPRIVIPANVREVSWFFQRNDWPRGRQPVAADKDRTLIHAGRELIGVTHHYMDDQAVWWDKCLQVAAI